jgi:hypothetical protein
LHCTACIIQIVRVRIHKFASKNQQIYTLPWIGSINPLIFKLNRFIILFSPSLYYSLPFVTRWFTSREKKAVEQFSAIYSSPFKK